jgi:hypothetical protein
VPPVIRLASCWKICQIIGMCIGNEIVFDFIELVFVVIVLVFIFVNFGFDIEELIAAFPSTFSAMTLQKLSDTVAWRLKQTESLWNVSKGNLNAHCDLFLIVVVLIFFILILMCGSSCIFPFAFGILFILVLIVIAIIYRRPSLVHLPSSGCLALDLRACVFVVVRSSIFSVRNIGRGRIEVILVIAVIELGIQEV